MLSVHHLPTIRSLVLLAPSVLASTVAVKERIYDKTCHCGATSVMPPSGENFISLQSIAYIPLQCETTRFGVLRRSRPPTRRFCIAYTNMLVSRNHSNPTRHQIYPNATPNLPNASRWNIDCVRSPRIGSHVGHVDFMLFVSISFTFGSQCECSFRWNIGL